MKEIYRGYTIEVEVFDAILDDKITLEQLNTMLYSYRDNNEAQP